VASADPPATPNATDLDALLAVLDALPARFEAELAALGTDVAVRDAQARALKGPIAEGQAAIRQAPGPMKRTIGAALNKAKTAVEAAAAVRLEAIAREALDADLKRSIDVSLPGRATRAGHLHIITQVRRDIVDIFRELGFEIAEGPQVETDFNNFEALNIPKDHPARDMQDTFYVSDDVVLRTHTSPVQIRTMLRQKPPVKVICPGLVYRRDDDPTHSRMFTQVEGLLVDRDVSMADLKGTLLHFVRRFFGGEIKLRFRPSFFPFTEPSAEVDMSCIFCGGTGCRLCKQSGWLEIGGSGMVDPEVFKAVGYDPEAVTGYAFGLGIERMAMLRHGINDIRLYYEGDVRFLQQF
jgi:phenylalanyl-tRNA synthetase alpha chain